MFRKRAFSRPLSGGPQGGNRLRLRFAGAIITLLLVFGLFLAPIYSYFSDRVGGSLDITLRIPAHFVKIEGGQYHVLALTSDGRVYSWGRNNKGQTGTGGGSTVNYPTRISSLSNVVDIDAGPEISFAVTSDGKVYGWGDGGSYALGNGSTTSRNTPTLITMPSGVKFEKVSVGGNAAMALTTTGDIYSWGDNGKGQCGNGSGSNVQTPTRVKDVSGIKEIAMGGYTGAAVKNNGVLLTWGDDSSDGQLGDSLDRGSNNYPANYSGLTDVKYIHAAARHMAAITESGRVYTWGVNGYGRIGNGSASTNQKTPYMTSITNGMQVGGYQYETLVVTAEGRL